jgi:hypothetical protein
MYYLDGKHSKQVHWARYDEATQTLEVDFKDRHGNKASTYSYHERLNADGTSNPPHGFTMAEWRDFQDAVSKGTHFAAKIRHWPGKQAGYKGVRIS